MKFLRNILKIFYCAIGHLQVFVFRGDVQLVVATELVDAERGVALKKTGEHVVERVESCKREAISSHKY